MRSWSVLRQGVDARMKTGKIQRFSGFPKKRAGVLRGMVTSQNHWAFVIAIPQAKQSKPVVFYETSRMVLDCFVSILWSSSSQCRRVTGMF